jgi:hypothetical protein
LGNIEVWVVFVIENSIKEKMGGHDFPRVWVVQSKALESRACLYPS